MKKGMCAFFIGLILSSLFSGFFLGIQNKEVQQSQQVYYLQVGVYQTKDNATKMQLELSRLNLSGYVYTKDQLHYLICAICTDIEELKEYETLLSQQSIAYVRKEKTLTQVGDNESLEDLLLEVLSL